MQARLLADPAVAAMIVDRIMPDIAIPQINAYPLAIYSRLNSGEEYDLEGKPYKEIARLEYSCIGQNYLDTRNLVEALRTAALAARGLYNGIMIDSVFVADIRDQGFNSITTTYQIDLDLEVHRIF